MHILSQFERKRKIIFHFFPFGQKTIDKQGRICYNANGTQFGDIENHAISKRFCSLQNVFDCHPKLCGWQNDSISAQK
jgi:hypothetical protein